MVDNDSDSSDEEWEVTSTTLEPKSPVPVLHPKRRPKPSISKAGFRQVRAAIPKSQRLPVFATPPIEKFQPQNLDYMTFEELHELCLSMDSKQLVARLVGVYKNAETYLCIREIETATFSLEARLTDQLQESPDPCTFVQQLLYEIATYFEKHSSNKDMTNKFRRLLAHAVCNALENFLRMPPLEKPKEKDLISFADDGLDTTSNESNLISFEDVDDEENKNDEDDEDDEDGVTVETITLAELMDVLPEVANRYKLTRDHQDACIRMIDTIASPLLVYYAMDVFGLKSLLRKDGECEEDGVKLCELLLRHASYNEAITCIRKLDLYSRFPIRRLADQLLTVGQGSILSTYVDNQKELRRELLWFINVQLRFNYAGSLGIVTEDRLQSVAEADTISPLSRLHERTFQRDLVHCGTKIIQDAAIHEQEFYFIWLSQRYAALRSLIFKRAHQQLDENDLTISASSNYNGLIELVAHEDPALAKLTVKELIDIGDSVAPAYFANILGQQEFYCRYNALPLQARLVGIVRGEQISSHRSTLSATKRPNSPIILNQVYYAVPPNVLCKMVDDEASLQEMRVVLAQSGVYGLDTEWVPQFARSTPSRTALMQIATNLGHVFLLDLKTLREPLNYRLLALAEIILRQMFERKSAIKLAYDFKGDMALLQDILPTAKDWNVACMADLKHIRAHQPGDDNKAVNKAPVGLAGVVSMFLGVGMNKKQRLSNWELRPLTDAQIHYAAGDAYCLIEIYMALVATSHPFIQQVTEASMESLKLSLPISPPLSSSTVTTNADLECQKDFIQF
ncbi:Exonuclease mut-7 [Apophysomyces sp. BC1034]|nr:Exonuclease mut-7 [Apophysomyces sp. BC1015]KAG0182371.1 Exonuclease mut-7 [Apophysomyces sp. BC1021]KAG0192828.1 Exonuclease mut-7 [Apophysomyces sp. BC1034]